MTILPKLIYIFNIIPVGMPAFLITNWQSDLKIDMEMKIQDNLEKEEEVGRLTRPYFKIYHQARVIKTTWYWHKDSDIDK